jgi:hypothetical protein
MGGSGGGYFSGRVDPDSLRKRIRDAEDQEQSEAFESQVSEFLGQMLTQCNNRDVEAINADLERIKSDLSKDIDGTVDILFGGSVAKHTYVDGLSDVDSLVVIPTRDASGKPPEQIKQAFADKLIARYGSDAVTIGDLAVTVQIGGHSIQLLPAVKDGSGLKIANQAGTGWSRISPQRFASKLTRANREQGGKLVPTIKLAKSILGRLPESRRLSGYHVESLAIEAFRGYDGPKTCKQMLRHFFERAGEAVRSPIRDSSGQSVHVDEYLGARNSPVRRIAADTLGRIGRRIKNADGASSLSLWKAVFGEE